MAANICQRDESPISDNWCSNHGEPTIQSANGTSDSPNRIFYGEHVQAYDSPSPHVSNQDLTGETPGGDKLEPIAVVGMAIKFPQDATTPEAFWEMLVKGRSALSGVPKERYNVDAFYHPDGTRPGVMNVREGHFIKEDLACFDATFFSMTPAEAECVDPQQRWLLETTYHALENAGIPIEKVAGSNTSVHVGSLMHDFEIMLSRDPEMRAQYKTTGTPLAMLANRVSWFYDFTGPSIALDTACSSSLTALHLACHCLRSGESCMVRAICADLGDIWKKLTSPKGVVAGCNLIFNPDATSGLADLNFLSPDSKSYSFDHRANGYARGEGIGVVIVKTLSNALKDNDTIRAVIRATSSNQDGRTPVVTQPSAQAQEAMIRQAYLTSGLSMDATGFFEAHGTGTPIGDSVEAQAIHNAFKERSRAQPLYIGAAKANIGHLESASGLAGLVKVVLALEKGIIPPNIHFERVNPKILAEAWNIKFPIEPTSWPTDGLRRASVNSFGFGGSNCHAVLDDAYNYLRLHGLSGRHGTLSRPPARKTLSKTVNGEVDRPSLQRITEPPRPKLIIWSAYDERGLDRLAAVYSSYLQDLPSDENKPQLLEDLAYTHSERRSHMPWKAFTIAGSIDQLQQNLVHGLSKPIRSLRAPKVGFIFTGQGAEWPAMGRELLGNATFRKSLEDTEKFLRGQGCTWRLIDELKRDEETTNLRDPVFSQPICTALQIALIQLLSSWGIAADVVIGHSSGEIAAAYYIGGLSWGSALKVAFYRGLVTGLLKKPEGQTPGAMIVVGLSETDAALYIRQIGSENTLCVACMNGPHNTTISGSEKDVNVLQSILEEEEVFHRKLNVKVAYHSKFMNEIAVEYQSLIQDISSGKSLHGEPIMISTVTGQIISSTELSKSDYWVKNMVSPVKFTSAINYLYSTKPKKLTKFDEAGSVGVNYFCEIGPHAVLKHPIRENLDMLKKGGEIGYTSILLRDKSALNTAMEAAGNLHCIGYQVNIKSVCDFRADLPHFRMLTDLPSYPFNHTKNHWAESRLSIDYRFRRFPRHELLGTPVSDWNLREAKWRNIITNSENSWINDHKVNGSTVYPGAGFLVMAIEASRQLKDPTKHVLGYTLRDVILSKALVVPAQGSVEAQFFLRSPGNLNQNFPTWCEFCLYVHESGTWSENCRGMIAVEYEKEAQIDEAREQKEALAQYARDHEQSISRCQMTMSSKQLYDELNRRGLDYGPVFRSLKNIRFNNCGESTAVVDLHEWMSKTSDRIQQHVIHPAALDAIFQLCYPAVSRGGRDPLPTMVLTKINRLWISGSENDPVDVKTVKVCTEAKLVGHRSSASKFLALDTRTSQTCVVGEIETTTVANMETSSPTQPRSTPICYNVDWKPDFDVLPNKSIESYCSAESRPPSTALDYMFEEKTLLCHLALLLVKEQLVEGTICIGKPHFQDYVEWMKYQLSAHAQPNYRSLAHDTAFMEQLQGQVGKIDIEGKLILRVANNIQDILRGRIDVLDLLFNDGLMSDYYRFINQATSVFARLATYIDTIAHKRPGMNILEIGAGSGSATLDIIGALTCGGTKRFNEYVFTDISPSFFEKARVNFQAHRDKMKFLPLNIEKDPSRQGFNAKYDLIVASNVMHATASLKTTLRNTRKLLKPGGKLLIYETITNELVYPGFVFGLLPGWWLGTEEIRKLGPLITEGKWNEFLSESGFSGVDIVLRDSEKKESHRTSLMISTALEPESSHRIPSKVVILDDYRPAPQSAQSQHCSLSHQLKLALEKWEHFSCSIIPYSQIAMTDFEKTICVILPDPEQTFLRGMKDHDLKNLQRIITSASGLLWTFVSDIETASNPTSEMITGFSRCIRGEESRISLASLAIPAGLDTRSAVDHVIKVFQASFLPTSHERELEYAVKNGMLGVNRLVEAKYLNGHILSKTKMQSALQQKFRQEPSRSLQLTIGSPGLLDTLRFTDSSQATHPVAHDEIEMQVKASGVNFRDVLIALGQHSADYFGSECAGIVVQAGKNCAFEIGDRVCCSTEGSYQTYARCKAATVSKIPDEMSFTSAAAIMGSYVTAYYALIRIGQIKPKESILIHSAAGGLGQASIQIAQLFGAEIYATVGTEEKRAFLTQTYGIQDDHIFYNRSPVFVRGIKRMTKGRGVDIIINSLSGGALRSTWEECLAPCGRFLETGKKDIQSFGNLPMSPFSKNVTFASIDILYLLRNANHIIGELMQAVLALYRDQKITLPKPLQVYNASQIEQAFRSMQSGKNIGKMVIEFGDDDIVATVPSMLPTYSFDPDATYLIAGGLGGLGRSIARWMVSRSARNLILLSRSGPQSESSRILVEEMKREGINLVTPCCDVSDKEALESVLRECRRNMPPVKGCIQGAMTLKDVGFVNMSLEDFNAAVTPKVKGSWNLHSLLPTGMDFFVLLSSVSGIISVYGQSNYAAGNAYQDALARYRIAHGEKAVSIDLGSIRNVGYVAERDDLAELIGSDRYMSISEAEFHAILDYYCDPTVAVSSLHSQVVTGFDTAGGLRARKVEEPFYMSWPMFSHLGSQDAIVLDDTEATTNYETLFEAAESIDQIAELIVEGLQTKLSKMLAIETGSIDPSRPLQAFGIDSLAAVEIRTWFKRTLGADVAVFDILSNNSVASFGALAAGQSRFVPASLKKENEDGDGEKKV